jgi:hypothetical protein
MVVKLSGKTTIIEKNNRFCLWPVSKPAYEGAEFLKG